MSDQATWPSPTTLWKRGIRYTCGRLIEPGWAMTGLGKIEATGLVVGDIRCCNPIDRSSNLPLHGPLGGGCGRLSQAIGFEIIHSCWQSRLQRGPGHNMDFITGSVCRPSRLTALLRWHAGIAQGYLAYYRYDATSAMVIDLWPCEVPAGSPAACWLPAAGQHRRTPHFDSLSWAA